MTDALRDQIRDFILENYLFTTDTSALGLDDSLLGRGIVDSTGMLEIIFFIEEQLGVKVKDEEMIPDNLDSVNKIANFVLVEAPGCLSTDASEHVHSRRRASSEHARRNAGAPALVVAQATLEYADLRRRDRLRVSDRAAGCDAGDRVALLLRNSPQFVARYYGVLAAGARRRAAQRAGARRRAGAADRTLRRAPAARRSRASRNARRFAPRSPAKASTLLPLELVDAANALRSVLREPGRAGQPAERRPCPPSRSRLHHLHLGHHRRAPRA